MRDNWWNIVDEIIVSLDGDEKTHDAIRNIPGAFKKLKEGIQQIRLLDLNYKITARTVIHRLNFRNWQAIVDGKRNWSGWISFLPADVSSHAFNREVLWDQPKQEQILLSKMSCRNCSQSLNR